MIVNTTPANVLPNGAEGGTWLVQNLGTDGIYVGRTEAGVSPSTGVRIGAFQAVTIDLGTRAGSGIWAAAVTTTADVRVLKLR
jgi:hypothetical protein